MPGLFDIEMRAALHLDPRLDPTQVRKDLKDITEGFGKGMAKALEAGFSRQQVVKMSRNLTEIGNKLAEQNEKVANLHQAAMQKINAGLNADAEKAAIQREQVILEQVQRRYAKETKLVDRIHDRKMEALKEANRLAERGMGEAAEEFGEGVAKAFEDIKSFNIADLLKGAGKRVEASGAGMAARGAERGGATGKMMEAMGGVLSKLGPALIAVGAIAAGFAAIFKMVIDSDAQLKEFNKTLFDSGMAAGEVAGEFGEMGDTLDRIRKSFVGTMDALSFNHLWGTSAKDHFEILGAYAKAGLTFKELTAGVRDAREETEKLRDATAAALTYAKLLGTSNAEMAEHIATYMEELGSDIDTVKEGLSAVHMAARESGFGIKRFFNMVLQATTGMSMYNVRIEEAAGLLMRLGGILGSKMGGDYLQSLTKGFADEGYQDRRKRIMTTGGGRSNATFDRSAANMAKDFVDKLKGGGLTDAFTGAASKAGLKIDFGDSKGLVKVLGKLSATQRRDLLAETRKQDENLSRVLTNVLNVSEGAEGGREDMARGLGSLDMGGKLMMQLQQGMAVLGKPLHELRGPMIDAFESITGVSGEQREQLTRISEALYGNHAALLKLSKDEERYAKMTAFEIAAEQERQVKAYGAFVDESGQLVAAKLDENGRVSVEGQKVLGKEIGDYIQSQGAVFGEAAKAGVPVDTQLAQEMVARTTEMTKILEQGIEWWLEKIHGIVESFMNMISNTDESRNRQDALHEMSKKMNEQRKVVQAQTKLLSDLEASLKTAQTDADRESIKQKIAETKLTLTTAQSAVEQMAATRENIMASPAEVKWLGQGGPVRSSSQFIGEAQRGEGFEGSRSRALGVYDEDLRAEAEAKIQAEYIANVMKSYFGTSDRSEFEKGKPSAVAQDIWDAMETHARKLGGDYAKTVVAGNMPSAAQQEGDSGRRIWNPTTWLGNEDRRQKYIGPRTGVELTPDEGGQGAFERGLAELDPKAELERLNKEQARRDLEALRAETKLHGQGGKAPKAYSVEFGKEFERVSKEQQTGELMQRIGSTLGQAGIKDFSNSELENWAKELQRTGEAPPGLAKHLNTAAGGKTVKDLLWERGVYMKPKAQDFLMQIGEGGRVKFAQRIDTADQVTAVASKGGGAIDQAGRRGGNGSVNHHHYYNDAKGVYSQWQKLQQARVLG